MAAPHRGGGSPAPRIDARPGRRALGLCIVGCGRFARFHARAARRLRCGPRLAFASRDRTRAEAYRRRFRGFAAFGSYEDAAADPDVDAVVVCTPHHLHAAHVRLAADHGKAVLLEKPIARTVAEADAILETARASGITLMVAENAHFMPAFAAARAQIRTGVIGSVRQLIVSARGFRRPRDWRARRSEMGGGPLVDGGIHYVRLLRDWAGHVVQVAAMAPPNLFPDLEAEDTVLLLLRFESGAVAALANSVAAPGLPRWQWAWATGTEGSLAVDQRGRVLWIRTRAGRRFRAFLRDRRGLRAQLAEFVAAVAAGRDPVPAARAARDDLAVVEAAYRSLELGAPVSLAT
jgi:predicted dehydrogenase